MMPPEKIIDRISGRSTPTSAGRIALGRLMSVPDAEHALNGTAPGHFHDAEPGREDAAPVDAVTMQAVITIGERVAALRHKNAAHAALSDVSPLLDGAAARLALDRHPFEFVIAEHRRFLLAVCFRPAGRVRRVDRLLPVSRARLVTPRSLAYLAAHSEDWSTLRPDGVRPERVLSPEREGDLDLYENRVAAHLGDQSRRFLTMRIGQIRGISEMLSDIQQYVDDLSTRPWRKGGERLWELVADLIDQNGWREEATRRIAELDDLRTRVSAVRSSPVWRGVDRRASLGATLRTTNLLTNDERYRGVAELWHRWTATRTNAGSADERRRQFQRWCQGFAAYVEVLVVRALDEIGAAESASTTVSRPATYLYGTTKVTLVHDEGNVLCLCIDDKPLVRVVALPDSLTASPAGASAELEAISHAQPSVPTLVLYPGTREQRAALATHTRLRAFESPGAPAPEHRPENVWAIPVSPLEIDSVVRLARALRWFLEHHRLSAYPQQVPCEPALARSIATVADWLSATPTGFVVHRIPAEHELAAARTRSSTAWTEVMRGNRRDSAQELLRSAWEDIQAGVERTKELTTCPQCGATSPQPERTFQFREDGTYHCHCPVCKAEWEIRLCRSCERAYPLIGIPAGSGLDVLDGDQIDRKFSVDLLAAPCVVRDRIFICPWCAKCGNAQGSRNCARCTLPTG
ncbi:hypothetical protein AB0B66_08240 [Catellatospora sp. NPDC049111]|uniref:hypothetical protein n=1 Tax=Catellatospora sp. NPDC049111 TaxID=3155271 RepID=UPI0033D46263